MLRVGVGTVDVPEPHEVRVLHVVRDVLPQLRVRVVRRHRGMHAPQFVQCQGKVLFGEQCPYPRQRWFRRHHPNRGNDGNSNNCDDTGADVDPPVVVAIVVVVVSRRPRREAGRGRGGIILGWNDRGGWCHATINPWRDLCRAPGGNTILCTLPFISIGRIRTTTYLWHYPYLSRIGSTLVDCVVEYLV